MSITAPKARKHTIGYQEWCIGWYYHYLNPLLADWKKHGTLSGDSAVVSKTEVHGAWGLTHILLGHVFGRCRQSSTNWSWPMTDMLAPKSTIPEDPWDTKQAVSTGFRLPVTVGRRGSAGGGMLLALSSVIGLFLQRACSRLVRSGRTFINWDFNGFWIPTISHKTWWKKSVRHVRLPFTP